MERKILIVNSFDRIWKYIPMGSFGLCDFLNQQGIESQIFNAGSYNDNEYLIKLKRIINNYKPDYIGLIIHWEELLENSIYLSYEIKTSFPNIIIIAGGMTASFLSEELLRRFKSIDFVIQGDPEKPLQLFIDGESVSRIPNLVYRDDSIIRKSKLHYNIESKTLNNISFSKIQYLIDQNKYINIIDTQLGFPIFIGRGCSYNCLFCGGSKKAFQIHSNRGDIVYRNIESVIRDLKLLLKYTDNIYLSYECNIEYIYDLFVAILSDKALVNKFTLNYGAWHLMDAKLIDLYSKAFKFKSGRKSIIEMSPETSFDDDRKYLRDKSLYFTNKQLLGSVNKIMSLLDRTVRINIYYSRYHKTQNNKNKLISELKNIHMLREHFYSVEHDNVNVKYMQLSTDVGSAYWGMALGDSSREGAVSLLLRFSRKYNYPIAHELLMRNLCIYSPKQLSEATRFKYEQHIIWIDLLLNNVPSYYFNITKSVGFSTFIRILDGIINEYYKLAKWYLFKNMSAAFLLDLIHEKIKGEYYSLYEKRACFFDGLLFLYKKYLNTKQPIYAAGAQVSLIDKTMLDKNKICITNYPYTSKQFYESLNNGIDSIKRERTLNVFCLDNIFSFQYRYYAEFKLFNGNNTFNDIVHKIGKNNSLSKDEMIRLFRFFKKYQFYFTV